MQKQSRSEKYDNTVSSCFAGDIFRASLLPAMDGGRKVERPPERLPQDRFRRRATGDGVLLHTDAEAWVVSEEA